MFDILKPPRVRIAKRIPIHAAGALGMIEAYADVELAVLSLNPKREQAAAFIISVWACNSAAAGEFQLPMNDYTMIKNTGLACLRFLTEAEQSLAFCIVEKLMANGMIPGTPPPT